MKILVFGGGLGNQIFGYAFTSYLRKKYPDQKIYGVYNKSYLSEHYGLEINRWFDVELPPAKWYISFFTYFLYTIKKLTGWTGLLDLNQVIMEKEDAIVYFALHTDKRYIPEGDWLKFKVNEKNLDDKNYKCLNDIYDGNSVFIHVRRGDYLSPKYKDRFEGCCTLDYYIKAIEYVKENINNPQFYIFSNDLNWCKENLPVEKPVYVDWNTDERSPLDMFLMSQCSAGIIANSSFSYWGAMLGKKKKITTYPEKWVNPPFTCGDIFPDYWIKL